MPVTDTRKEIAPIAFRLFKYTIYCLLAYNIWLFFLEDFAASVEIFSDGVTWRNVVEAYSATIDTLAWVILLLLFELETAVIPDEKLQGSLKWFLSVLRGICYVFIIYAFYGYVAKFNFVTNLVPFSVTDVCSLIGSEITYAETLNEYFPLTLESCTAMQGMDLQQMVGTQIIGTQEQHSLVYSLAVTDVINAANWLIIVVVLEAEVWLQINGRLSDQLLKANKYLKGFLYTILFGCAAFWGVEGGFLDFWDAVLWLLAFIFIEMNIFEWQAETTAAEQ